MTVTGLPKAVQGRHGPLTHFYPWMKSRFELTENDHFSMCSGISHDPLQRDIFTPLFLGATIHVPDANDIGKKKISSILRYNFNVNLSQFFYTFGNIFFM